MEVGISLANVYHVLINSLGKWSLCQVDSTHPQRWPNGHASSSCHYPSAAWRFESNAFVNCILILWVTYASLDPQLKRLNAEWCAQMSLRKKTAWVRLLWKSRMSCFSAKMDLFLTISCQLVWWPMAIITAHSCRIRSSHSQPVLLKQGVILLQDNGTPHIHHDMQNLVQCWG